MTSLLATSFGDRFCLSRKGGIGGGGWVHPKGANSMAASGLISRNDLGGTERAISVPFGMNQCCFWLTKTKTKTAYFNCIWVLVIETNVNLV